MGKLNIENYGATNSRQIKVLSEITNIFSLT
jgi:hypothetical protein